MPEGYTGRHCIFCFYRVADSHNLLHLQLNLNRMESPDNPRIEPPDPNNKKKAGGSFAKRNIWLIVIMSGVILIGGGSWYVYSKIRHLSQYRFQNLTINQPDSIGNSLPFDTDELFTAQADTDASIAQANIDAGAINYRLKDTTRYLFSVNTVTAGQKYILHVSKEGLVPVLDFRQRGSKHKRLHNETPDSADVRLNINPQWELNVKTGGSNFEADLSKFKIRSLRFEGGAAVCKVRLGTSLANTNVSFSTGMSDVTIEIPKDAACHIHLKTSLSSSTFDGFRKKSENEYETQGFGKAKNKIFIDFEGAISDYRVDRY